MYSPAYGKSRVTILCVDDDEMALLVRKMVLESAGYIVFTAASSSKGLEIPQPVHALTVCRRRSVRPSNESSSEIWQQFSLCRKGRGLKLADRIEKYEHALTAIELAKLLNVSKVTVFKHAAAGTIPSFRIGSAVRFCPQAVADWLRIH